MNDCFSLDKFSESRLKKKEDERSVLDYNFIVTAMFEGQRLTYVVPGYTGYS